jgi:hypothetical protein
MKYLPMQPFTKKIIVSFIICFVCLIALAVLKIYLLKTNARDHHESIVYFVAVGQLGLLFIVFIYALFLVHRKWAAAFLVLMVVCELLIGYVAQAVFENPLGMIGKSKTKILFPAQLYVISYLFPIPQEDTMCVEYDAELYYIFKKNHRYNFKKGGFITTLSSNSAGVRDDETALQKPEIICLGDSYTMGWGMDKPNDFPSVIAKKTGKKVLNAGITSYGTARETILMRRLNTSNLQYLIIQYCLNDVPENKTYIKNNYHLPVSTKQRLHLRTIATNRYSIYFPFKYVLSYAHCCVYIIEQIINKDKIQAPTDIYKTQKIQEAAKDFLDILKQSTINFNKTKVFVYPELEGLLPIQSAIFCDEITRLTKNTPYARSIKPLMINIPDTLRLQPDSHYNLQGNEYVADIISKEILADMQ